MLISSALFMKLFKMYRRSNLNIFVETKPKWMLLWCLDGDLVIVKRKNHWPFSIQLAIVSVQRFQEKNNTHTYTWSPIYIYIYRKCIKNLLIYPKHKQSRWSPIGVKYKFTCIIVYLVSKLHELLSFMVLLICLYVYIVSDMNNVKLDNV